MSKYNIDNGKTAIVDIIKHHENHNQAKNLNRQLMTKDFLCWLYTYVGNWNACPLALSMWLSVLFGEAVDEGRD